MFILIFHVVLNERAKQEIFKTGWKNVGRVRAFVAGQPYHSSSYGGSKVIAKNVMFSMRFSIYIQSPQSKTFHLR